MDRNFDLDFSLPYSPPTIEHAQQSLQYAQPQHSFYYLTRKEEIEILKQKVATLEANVATFMPPHASTSSSSQTLPGPNLKTPTETLAKYSQLLPINHIGRLVVKLAQEAYFGKELLRKCTVYGYQDKPPLPQPIVESLKRQLYNIHRAKIAPHEFELYWGKCVGAINHHCSNLRSSSS